MLVCHMVVLIGGAVDFRSLASLATYSQLLFYAYIIKMKMANMVSPEKQKCTNNSLRSESNIAETAGRFN